MIIAVNTRTLPDDYPDEYRYFVYETFKRIVSNKPEHQFVFIADKKNNQPIIEGNNVTQIVTAPAATSPLLWKFWFDVKVRAILRKYKADVFVSCDGVSSLTTRVPQCLVIHDLAFLQETSFLQKSQLQFYKRNSQKFLNKANSIAVISAFVKKVICTQYNRKAAAIDIVSGGINELFQPIQQEEKTVTRNKYTDGKEYFLFAGKIHPANNLMNLLKAFSVFKKRQQTNMKLVFAGKITDKYKSFKVSLQSYKYRNDVVIIEHAEENELVKIMGAAYGLINPSLYEGFVSSVLQAMRCHVPVITAAGTSMQEITKDAGLYTDAGSFTSIADKMMLLYKDEKLRNELVQKGRLVAEEFSWEKTADLLWQSIGKAIR
jgi:glycosyltransferase involved in cell wall biosynthesis